MNRAKKLLLLSTVLALQSHALAARASDRCHAIAVDGADHTLVIRNPERQPLQLSLSFTPVATDPAARRLSCGLLSIAAGGQSNPTSLASLCPGLPSAQAGTLQACVVPAKLSPRPGIATGDLGADLLANNLPVAGR